MAQESRAAVLPPQRHETDPRRARRGGVVGQGGFQIPGLGRSQISRRRLSRRARRDCPPFRLYREKCGADALLRQCRGPGGRRHHDRYLGHGGKLRPDRRALPHLGRHGYWRGAGAAAGRANHHRGQLLHRRPRRSGRRRDRGRRQRPGHGRLHFRFHQSGGPRQRRDSPGQGAALFGGGVGFTAVRATGPIFIVP